jgi:hypothetical protein
MLSIMDESTTVTDVSDAYMPRLKEAFGEGV